MLRVRAGRGRLGVQWLEVQWLEEARGCVEEALCDEREGRVDGVRVSKPWVEGGKGCV